MSRPPKVERVSGYEGQPPKLTPQVQEDFCKYLRLGAHINVVCGMLGLDMATFHEWMHRARPQSQAAIKRAGGKPDTSNAMYAEFLAAIKKAISEHEIAALARLARAAQGVKGQRPTVENPDGVEGIPADPKWDAWILERRYAGRYSKQQRVELTGEDGAPIETVTHDGANLSDRISSLLARTRATARGVDAAIRDGDDDGGGED